MCWRTRNMVLAVPRSSRVCAGTQEQLLNLLVRHMLLSSLDLVLSTCLMPPGT